MSVPIAWEWLGRRPYGATLDQQHARRLAIVEERLPEVVWALEHDSVLTVGRRGAEGLEAVRRAGIAVHETGRGGLATWHGPGQLVLYGLVAIERRRIRVREYVAMLEDVGIAWAQSVGLPAERDPRGAGVWVEGKKLASVGIHVGRGVTLHGMALNLVNSLDAFSLFTPCGIAGVRMTSAAAHGKAIVPADAAQTIAPMLADAVDSARLRH